MELDIGTVLGDFTIIKHTGSGGMSEVYLVQDNLDRQFAMKTLSATITRDPSFRERLTPSTRDRIIFAPAI